MKKSKIYILYAVTLLFWFSTYIYTPMMPTYIKSLGASYFMVGLILGCYGVGQLVLRVPIGILSDRINKRKIFVIAGLTFLVLSSLGLYLFANPMLILVFRSFSGIASAFWVIFTVLYSSYFLESESTKAVGILVAFCNAGIMFGLVFGGFIVRAFDMKTTFLVSLCTALAGLVLSFGVGEKKINRRPAQVRELLMVLKDANFLTVSAVGVICQFVIFATLYGFTPVVARNMGASDFSIAMLSAVAALPSVIGSALSGSFLGKKFGEKNTMVYGLIISAVSCCILPFSKDFTMLTILQVICGLGAGTVFPLLMGLSIKKVSSDKRATAMGIFQAIYGLGMFLGPTIIGALSDSVGIDWGFITIGGVTLAGVLIALLYKEDKKQTSESRTASEILE